MNKQELLRYSNELFYAKYQDCVPYISDHDISEANKAYGAVNTKPLFDRTESDEDRNWERSEYDKQLHNI